MKGKITRLLALLGIAAMLMGVALMHGGNVGAQDGEWIGPDGNGCYSYDVTAVCPSKVRACRGSAGGLTAGRDPRTSRSAKDTLRCGHFPA